MHRLTFYPRQRRVLLLVITIYNLHYMPIKTIFLLKWLSLICWVWKLEWNYFEVILIYNVRCFNLASLYTQYQIGFGNY